MKGDIMKTLGIDLGGTKIAVAVVDDGKILARHRLDTPQVGFEAVLKAMAEGAKALLYDHPDVRHVGVGSPGPIDLKRGVVLFAPNIHGMKDAHIVTGLERLLNLPVVLENDANAAGLAEHLYGAAREVESSIYITISTGIGGGIFVGEKVLHGKTGSAGEVGHMTILPGGPLCGCGHYGCWEVLASGRAIAREASFSYGQKMSTVEVFKRAQDGEWRALKVIDAAANYSGLAIANLLKALDPDCFVIGGGMAQVGEFYLGRIRAAAESFCRDFPMPDLRLAQLGTDAGVIGAASVVRALK